MLRGRLLASASARALPNSYVQLRDHNKEQDLPSKQPHSIAEGLTPAGLEIIPSTAPEGRPQQSSAVTRLTPLPSLVPVIMLP